MDFGVVLQCNPPAWRASAASSAVSGECQKQNGASRIGVARQSRPDGIWYVHEAPTIG